MKIGEQVSSRGQAIINAAINSKYFWISIFALLTAFSAQISIPAKPVPFTLQTFIVVLSGAFLGARGGAYSQFLYLALGIIGLPVFAQVPDAPLGLARIIGPTGGYLIAFPAAAFLVGYLLKDKKSYLRVILSFFAGEILVITFGVFHLFSFYTKNLSEAIAAGAAIFSIWMIVKVFIASSVFIGIKGLKKSKS